MLAYPDDGQEVPISLPKGDAFLLLVNLLQDKNNVQFIIGRDGISIKVCPTHTKLFEQLVKGIYGEKDPAGKCPVVDPEKIRAYYVGGRADIDIAELTDINVINWIGRHVNNVYVKDMSKTEARQSLAEFGVEPKLEQHITKMLMTPARDTERKV